MTGGSARADRAGANVGVVHAEALTVLGGRYTSCQPLVELPELSPAAAVTTGTRSLTVGSNEAVELPAGGAFATVLVEPNGWTAARGRAGRGSGRDDRAEREAGGDRAPAGACGGRGDTSAQRIRGAAAWTGLTQPSLVSAVGRAPGTGELFEAVISGVIYRLDPQTWATTMVDSSTFGKPYASSVSDAGGARQSVVAAALGRFEGGSGVTSSATTISVRMPTTRLTRSFNKQSSIVLLLTGRRSICLTPLLLVIPATWA